MEPRLASLVIEGLKRAHVRFVVGLPDSLLAGVYAAAEQEPDIKYVAVTNEAEGASVAAGAWITGGRSVLVMENSGLRAACEAQALLELPDDSLPSQQGVSRVILPPQSSLQRLPARGRWRCRSGRRCLA